MKLGILADTHDEFARTRAAVQMLVSEGAETLVHCGDLIDVEIVAACAGLPFYFTFGNHDADTVPYLRAAALEQGATCLGWGGEIELAGKRIAVVHGHLTFDLRPLLNAEPDYLLSGHSHIAGESIHGRTRRINPGALHRADRFSVALLDLNTDELQFLSIG
jgi:putative phosphoesterase